MENEWRKKFNKPAVNAVIDYREIDVLIHFHFENIRELIEDMNDTFNSGDFNDGEMIKIMRSISNEIEINKYYKGLNNENKS